MFLYSILIPTYDRVENLMEAIDSIRRQSFPDFEVIVIDDGSKDGTQAAVLEMLQSGNAENLKLKYLKQENAGPGAARNLGAREAQGEYLAFLDSDDLWFPWTLDVYRQVIEHERSPGFLAGCPYVFETTSQLQSVARQPLQTKTYSDYLASGDERRWWGVSSFVVKKSLFEKVGGFASEFVNGEDADFVMKCGMEPGFVQVLSPNTFGYRKHEANITKAFEKNLAGARLQIRNERMGIYPGGKSRERERWHILSRQIRPVAVAAVENGNLAAAWEIYKATFRWHVELLKCKFIFGFFFAISLRFLMWPKVKISCL